MKTLLFGIPPVHCNVWHNSFPSNPFPFDGKTSLWRKEDTRPPNNQNIHDKYSPSIYNEEVVKRIVENCKTEKIRINFKEISSIEKKAALAMIEMNYYPTRFKTIKNL
jgi:hypothetical protein